MTPGVAGGGPAGAKPAAWRPRIGVVLLTMNLAMLGMPLGGLWAMRLYESALIRQTESELITQGAVIAAAYRAFWRNGGADPDALGPLADPRWTRHNPEDGPWLPRFATLDLADDEIHPTAPAGERVPIAPHVAAIGTGVAVTAMLREAQRVTLAGVRIVDPGGVVVATTGGELGLSLLAREEVRRALTGEPVSLLRRRDVDYVPPVIESISRGAALRVFTALPVLVEDRVLGAVILSRTPRTIDQALHGKRWQLLAAGLILLAATVALAVLGGWLIARPIALVTARAKQVAEGGRAVLAALPAVPAIREVAELALALDRMAATLDRRATYLRDFANQVSHEFKTPLASIRATAELLQDHLATMTEPDQRRFIDNIGVAAERMERLVNRLLALARADLVPVAPPAGVAVAPLLARLAPGWAAAGLAIEITAEPALVAVIAEDALETVLGNLLDNVRQHGGPGVTVRLSARRQGEQAVIRVEDDGPGVSAANAGRIFDRFFTTARRQGGTGLGLAIVRSLVDAHHGRVALVPSARGACFEVHLPSPPATPRS